MFYNKKKEVIAAHLKQQESTIIFYIYISIISQNFNNSALVWFKQKIDKLFGIMVIINFLTSCCLNLQYHRHQFSFVLRFIFIVKYIFMQ